MQQNIHTQKNKINKINNEKHINEYTQIEQCQQCALNIHSERNQCRHEILRTTNHEHI